jgi:hypothetical protein
MSLIVPSTAFVVEGELKLFERSSDSGRALRCYFCPECGTRVYHQPSYMEGIANVKAGTLDDTSWLAPQMHTWTSSKQPWFELPAGVGHHLKQP